MSLLLTTPFIVPMCIGLSLAVLWWLRADMKRQREWREAKELKMARLQRRIADKKKRAEEE